MPISEQTYQQVALEDPDNLWELVCGHLRRKPWKTTEHESVKRTLARTLIIHLDDRDFIVAMEGPKLRTSAGSYYVPDVCVFPRAFERVLRKTPGQFEVYNDPMPLVVEIWSPSTGEYDVKDKLAEYRRRGDQEIWLIHPYERTLVAWRHQPDGTYTESRYRDGTIKPRALPAVEIEIQRLFE
ncbi:MAG: Uma2 family endonuclease [Dehalococcoidia bacterium]